MGYLLKPVRRERLEAALKHASRLSASQLHRLSTPEQPLAARQHVAVRVRDELKLIPVERHPLFRGGSEIRHRAPYGRARI